MMSNAFDIESTLVSILEQNKDNNLTGITFIQGSFNEVSLSYSELYSEALSALKTFQDKGLKQGDELVIQIDDNRSFVITFWACLFGGIIPVPLSLGSQDDHKNKLIK